MLSLFAGVLTHRKCLWCVTKRMALLHPVPSSAVTNVRCRVLVGRSYSRHRTFMASSAASILHHASTARRGATRRIAQHVAPGRPPRKGLGRGYVSRANS